MRWVTQGLTVDAWQSSRRYWFATNFHKVSSYIMDTIWQSNTMPSEAIFDHLVSKRRSSKHRCSTRPTPRSKLANRPLPRPTASRPRLRGGRRVVRFVPADPRPELTGPRRDGHDRRVGAAVEKPAFLFVNNRLEGHAPS